MSQTSAWPRLCPALHVMPCPVFSYFPWIYLQIFFSLTQAISVAQGEHESHRVKWQKQSEGVSFHYSVSLGTNSEWEWNSIKRGKSFEGWACGRTASKEKGIQWKTPFTSLLFCSMMGCRTSGIDLQVGKFDTRQGKSTREVGKMRE